MKVLNAMQLKKGAKTKKVNESSSLVQPLQFLLSKEKDEEWTAWNLDWFEYRGLQYLKDNSRKILKQITLLKKIMIIQI
jgi:hypothetical protein